MPNQNPNDPYSARTASADGTTAPGSSRRDQPDGRKPADGGHDPLHVRRISRADTAAQSACPTCGCPITPNPSGTPEAFMDTPVVNGNAYPVLHVAPAAYRFRILSAGNDRSWNLSWFVADPTPATTRKSRCFRPLPPATGTPLPLCTAINPVAVPSLDYRPRDGPSRRHRKPDERNGPSSRTAGRTTDPSQASPRRRPCGRPMAGLAVRLIRRNAGPAWIQIGTEGGLLPAPVVIPPTPINYEQNTRSITITQRRRPRPLARTGGARRRHRRLLASLPARRSFSTTTRPRRPRRSTRASTTSRATGTRPRSAAHPTRRRATVPTPAPSCRSSWTSAAPNTVPFSLPTLKAAFASTATTPGLFAATQPTTIVPEAAYNSAYNKTFPNTYAAHLGQHHHLHADRTADLRPLLTADLGTSCGTTLHRRSAPIWARRPSRNSLRWIMAG